MKITSIETILIQIPFDIGGGPQAIAGAATTKLEHSAGARRYRCRH